MSSISKDKSIQLSQLKNAPSDLNNPRLTTQDTYQKPDASDTLHPQDLDEYIPFDSFDEVSEATIRIDAGTNTPIQQPESKHVIIRVIAGNELLKFIEIAPGDQIMIGRDERCELQLHNRAVSKKHAVINFTKKRALNIVDVGSTNGTFVNKRRITSKTSINSGDQLEIGDISLQVSVVTASELEHMWQMMSRLEFADRDSLTNLYRRDFFEEQLPRLISEYEEMNIPVSCAFIDLDKFKPINDTFGHKVGDEVLKAVSKIIRHHLRKNDPCIRYGGDEMLLVLPKVTEQAAIVVVERIRNAIHVAKWSTIANGLSVSASFGIAEKHPLENIKTWIDRADQATYASKHGGRNLVRTYTSLTYQERMQVPKPTALVDKPEE